MQRGSQQLNDYSCGNEPLVLPQALVTIILHL